MITVNDIKYFYSQYKHNLKIEQNITESLMKTQSDKEWITRLKQKNQIMKQLYIENEALLNLYVRPIVNQRVLINENIAEEFIDQIRIAEQEGFEDSLCLMEVCEALLGYFKENGPIGYYIWTLSLLGIYYNNSSEIEEGRKGFVYFDKVCALKDEYFELEDFEVRKRIIYAFYNRVIVQVNFSIATTEEIKQNLNEALAFFNNPKIRAYDGKRFDFDGLMEELNYDVFGNYILVHTRENMDQEMLMRAKKVLKNYYDQELLKNANPYCMPDEIYCYYKYCLFYNGEISCTEFLDDYIQYCDYSLEHDQLVHPDGFWESKLFQVTINHLPGILKCLKLYGNEYHGNPSLKKHCIQSYLKGIHKFPRTGNSRFVNDVVCRSLYEFLEMFMSDDADSEILLNVLIARDEITLVHSQMVSSISQLLANAIIDQKPELFINTLQCQSIVDVLENRNAILTYLSQASKLFDIGKLKDCDIVNKQSRQLTLSEFKRIYQHCDAGARIIQKISTLKPFYDVILGHHKSWDSKIGYPSDFDNTKSVYRILIELIHISDCMDAACDFIGRSYKTPKTFEEFLMELERGKGTIYSNDIVDLIQENQNLQNKLKYLLNQGRMTTYSEVYGMTLNNKEDVNLALPLDFKNETKQERLLRILHESSEENANFVYAMVKQSLLTLYVDLSTGQYHVFSESKQKVFDYLPNGIYSDFIHTYLKKIAHPQDFKKLQYQFSLSEIIHTLIKQKGTFECELRLHIQHAYKWVRIQFTQMDDSHIVPREMTLMIKDVDQSHNRSEQMKMVLKQSYQTAIQANKAKNVFLGNMSHDIRTPMNGIMGMTQIALSHLDDKERVEDCLHKIDESSKHLLELINEVLDMSRIESGRVQLHLEPVCLDDLLTSVVQVCKASYIHANHTLSLDYDCLNKECVNADAVRLRQIFTNVLSNAMKYTPNEGHIQIQAFKLAKRKEKYNYYRFVIQDDGIGMSEEFQKKLYEPFSREYSQDTQTIQGTGLGLSIVKSMVETMGGSIQIESKLHQGTRVEITLHLEPLVIHAQENKEEDFVSFDTCRILLAEDNVLNREIACELLESIGCVVKTAANGKVALEIYKNHDNKYFDAILMDLQMPVMDGYQAAKEIRKIEKKIPIIALSANVFEEDITKAIECGMNEHLSKPMDLNQLKFVLSKWI